MNAKEIFELLNEPGRNRIPIHDKILDKASSEELANAFHEEGIESLR
jgi:hypothetical protein